MAINENPARNAAHCSVVMKTGGGKGIALNSLDLVPRRFPAAIFDPHGEHKKLAGRKVTQYRTRRWFAKGFLNAWKSGKPFVVGYAPKIQASSEKEAKKRLQAEAEWFARLIWEAADGNRILYPVFEEYGEYCDGVASDDTTIGKIWTGGRKFGLRGIAIFQRSAQISKTIWGNSDIKVVGIQGYENDIKRVVEAVGCTREDVIDIGYRNSELEMYAPDLDEMVRTKVHYLYSKSVGTFEKVACYVKPAAHLRKNWTSAQRKIAKEGGYRLIV